MIKLEWMFYRWKPVRYVRDWSKRTIVPGLENVSIYAVSRFFIREINNLNINEKAAAVTYNFIMALPPTLLFLFSLVPYLPLSHVQATILDTLQLVTPNKAIYKSVSAVVVDFMHTQHKELLSFGILLVLYFASNGIMGLMTSFDASLSLYKKRNYFSRRWTAIKLTFVLICVAIASLVVLIVQSTVLNFWILKIFHSKTLILIGSFSVLVMLIFCAISLIYVYGPSLTHSFKFVSAGSVIATIASLVATVVFFYLVNHFLNYNKVYGSIGTVIAFMVWVWINTLIILICYELNVSILLGKISVEKDEAKKEKV
jgi:membrane protein